MSELLSRASSSPIEFQGGELYQLTFQNDGEIADEFRFCSQDIGSQTEEKDIIKLQDLTCALSRLTEDNFSLKREFILSKANLQSEFHRRLTDASNQLYSRMNQRLDDVERSQKDRVEVVRRAFRTQLSDALSQMAVLYRKKINEKLHQEKSYESDETQKCQKKIAELSMKLKKAESKVKELQKQVDQYAQHLAEIETEEQPTLVIESDSESEEKEVVVMYDEEENQKLSDLINQKDELIYELRRQIETLEKQCDTNDISNRKMQAAIESLQNELHLANGSIDMLKSEKQIFQEKLTKVERQYEEKLNDVQHLQDDVMRLSIPPPSPPKVVIQKPMMCSVNIEKTCKEFPDMSQEVQNLKNQLQQYVEKENGIKIEISNIREKMITESKSYLEQIRILQSINGKLRKEMFIRVQLQTNFKSLHSASVAYAKNNQPIGILPSPYAEKESRTTMRIPTQDFSSPQQLLESDKYLLNNFLELNI